ncbi:ATP synthase subunit delta', mitochondrial-like isoform X2 [Henckelia pumila]|uniref:ATP synthase subunit delta', mitochondrial-like isoform X2 n=1 Tax=Henckelia pumila TaxID=405737 RepID=UPI003C6DF764
MLRRASACLLSHGRRLSTEASSDELFMAAWRRIMPNVDPPKTPLSFMHPRPTDPSPDAIPSKLTVNLVSPYSSLFSNRQVDMVTVPASSGQMGILPGHVSSISELKPGLLSVHEEQEVTKYFISSGFAFVHSSSITDIIAIEAVPIEQIDPSCVQKRLEEFNKKLNSASTDMETVEARVGIDVLTALHSALSE